MVPRSIRGRRPAISTRQRKSRIPVDRARMIFTEEVLPPMALHPKRPIRMVTHKREVRSWEAPEARMPLSS